MAENIKTRIEAVTDTTIEDQLNDLKSDIGCLEPKTLLSLRKLVEDKAGITEATRKKLRDLLVECQTLPEVQKSPEAFAQAFQGTKSDMLNTEHIRMLKGYILNKFNQFKDLSALQKDNLATATLDRVLSDTAFSGLFGDVSSGIKSLESGGVSVLLNAIFGDKKPESSDESKAKIEDTTTDVMGRIQTIIDNATKPLIELLSKTPVPIGLAGFLSNPRTIARYDGSGTIAADIAQMTDTDNAEYVKNLNAKVLEIDGKIISLESVREKGMDFVATAPSWMQDIFKWLLSLPIIGNMLASFLGHKDSTEALSWVDEEIRQRKSIMALREFGNIIGADGREKEGKYTGKIDILKGQDLSKIDRKRLAPFFGFTKEEGVDAGAPDFWIGIFEKGEIVKKDEKGEEVKYTLEKSIKLEDLDKDFEGLYTKLNKLHDIVDEKKRKEYSEQQTKLAEVAPLPGVTTPSVAPAETTKTPIVLPEINKFIALQKLTSEERKQIVIGNPRDWRAIFPKIIDLSDIAKISKEAATIDDFCSKNPIFMKSLRKESGNMIVTLDDFWIHKDRAMVVANKQAPLSPPPKVLATTPVIVPEIYKDEKALLVERFRQADKLPFEFGVDKKIVKFEGGLLKIGEKAFALKIGIVWNRGPDVLGIILVGPEVRLEYLRTSANIPRDKIIAGIPGLLEMTTWAKNEIEWDDKKGKLIITRMV